MIGTADRMMYQAFGLKLYSDIALPELSPMNDAGESPDIRIEMGDLPQYWNQCTSEPYEFITSTEGVIFKVMDYVLFFISGGSNITVSPRHDDYDEGLLRLYILGTCMGIALMQRRIYPLHGSAVAIGGEAYAVIGNSGAGKSTLASALLQQGCRLISDDVIAVSLDNNNKPMVTPAYPQQKLWQESLDKFNMDCSEYRSVYGRETKYCIPVSSQFSSQSLRLAGVFELKKQSGEHIQLTPIQSLERLEVLYRHTYRNFMIAKLGLIDWHFQVTARIAGSTHMHTVMRPDNYFTAEQLASFILEMINKEGLHHVNSHA